MAKFYAITEADIVGSMESLTFPLFAGVGPNALIVIHGPVATTPDYRIYNADGALLPTSNITSFAEFKTAVPFAVGAGSVDHVWKADSGDSYLFGTIGTASLDTFAGLALTPKVGDPTKTHGTEQQINQFFFKFDDKIYGSDGDDMLCGWAGDDKMWGGEGDDEFYYGKGMGKDRIMDLNRKDDEVILDTDLVKNFKKLKGDVKFKNDKAVMKFDSSDKLIVYGVSNMKQLKNVVAFDDFTDFA